MGWASNSWSRYSVKQTKKVHRYSYQRRTWEALRIRRWEFRVLEVKVLDAVHLGAGGPRNITALLRIPVSREGHIPSSPVSLEKGTLKESWKPDQMVSKASEGEGSDKVEAQVNLEGTVLTA